MLYRISPETTTTSLTISGRNLAHGHRSAIERAFIGGDLHLNRTQLVSPTFKQCSVLADVCVPYIAAAVAIVDYPTLCNSVLAGRIGLLDAAIKANNSETLAEHLARTSPTEWTEAARAVGPAVIWDRMIAPLV